MKILSQGSSRQLCSDHDREYDAMKSSPAFRTSDTLSEGVSSERLPLDIRAIPGKGRGVFARESIPAGALIEEAPVIVLSVADVARMKQTHLDHYLFYWDVENPEAQPPVCAVALGYLSLVNHATPANADFFPQHDALVIQLRATRAIAAGEEITIDYGIPLWFDPA